MFIIVAAFGRLRLCIWQAAFMCSHPGSLLDASAMWKGGGGDQG